MGPISESVDVLNEGQIIEGKYRIVRTIGAGGMGEVYEGENVRIRRRVAIKVLHADAAKNKDAVERFEREAQAAGQIGSDHILEVLDLGALDGGEHFIVMEFLDGETLGQRIERFGRMTPHQLFPLAIQALTGLTAAHQAGIIHRDLKPDNVFICREKAGTQDFVKIIDFGISKFQTVGGDMQMTRTGAVMGTPYYMSPEQARGSREVDLRSDLYAVGVILYEALSGNKPFTAETFNELLFKIVLSEPQPLKEIVPDVDPAFESIVYKAMARDVAHRFQSAGEFVAALESWAHTGKAVTIPPAIGHGPTGTQAMPEVRPAAGVPPEPAQAPAAAMGSPTPQVAAWASTGEAKPASRAPIVLGVAGGALVLLLIVGVGAIFALRGRHSATPEAEASASELGATVADETASAEPSSTPEPSAGEAASAAEAESAAEASSAEPEASAAPTGEPPAAKVAEGKVAPQGKPKDAAKKPAAASSSTAGQTKPGTPDFGY
jgi:eukaryotic-like serine/threonine-protein kinase